MLHWDAPFPEVMYGHESWTIKKAERWRLDAFELWCWRRLLRVPWTARRSNQSILKEISPGCSLEGLMLKLKLQYFGHLMWRTDSLEKMLGKIDGREERDDRGWDGWMASPTQWTWVWVNSRSWWWTGRPGVLQSMGSQRVRHGWAMELKWTESSYISEVFLQGICHRLNYALFPQKFVCWISNPHMTVFGDRAFRQVFMLNEVLRAEPQPKRTGVLIRKGRDTRDLVPSAHAHRTGRVRTRWEEGSLQPRKRSHRKMNVLTPWSWTSNFKNYEKINFCCLNHPVCANMLWQPEMTHTLSLIHSHFMDCKKVMSFTSGVSQR